jgi:hypothetical protein
MPNSSEAYGLTTITVYDQNDNIVFKKGGNPVSFDLVTKYLDFGDRLLIKYVDVVLMEMAEAQNLEFIEPYLEYQDDLSLAPTRDMLPLERGWEPNFVRASGRFFRLRIESEAPDVFFRLGKIEMYGSPQSRRF